MAFNALEGLTLVKSNDAETPPLPKRGDVGDSVYSLQEALVDRGITEVGEVDGAFGVKTEAGVQAFQEQAGLPRTGVVDQATFEALQQPLTLDEEGRGTVKRMVEPTSALGTEGETPDRVQASPVTDVTPEFTKKIKEQLRVHEGFKPYPYKDTKGLWTIGIGHLIGDGSTQGDYSQFSEENPMSTVDVDALFQEDLEEHLKIAQQYDAWDKVDERGKLALLDMTFNMGDLRVGWPNTLKMIARGDFEAVAEVIKKSKYARDVGSGRSGKIIKLFKEASLL